MLDSQNVLPCSTRITEPSRLASAMTIYGMTKDSKDQLGHSSNVGPDLELPESDDFVLFRFS